LEGVHAHLQQVHRTLAQLEVAAQLLTEVSVTLQSRVGIVAGLEQGNGEEPVVTSRAATPLVLMTHEQLALVGELTAEQVSMFVADEVVWEMQREEWLKEGSGGDDTDYSADSGKSR
jgi:hypothetical protein